MEEPIILPVAFEGKDYEFEIKIVPFGYLHNLIMTIEGVELTFEMDEERNYRVLADSTDPITIRHIKPELIQTIIDKLQSL